MAHRAWYACFVAVAFLGITVAVEGQTANFGGLGSAGELSSGSYPSLGTVPALAGGSGPSSLDEYGCSARERQPRGWHRSDSFPPRLALLFPGYLNSYWSATYSYADGYQGEPSGESQGQDQQGRSGSQAQGQNQNQNQNNSQGQAQNQNQGGNGQGQESKPEKPRYLTYSTRNDSGLIAGKSTKTLPVHFKSDPSGAEITVDGYFLGRTPNTYPIPMGKHLVSIQKWGFRSSEQELKVVGTKPLTVNAQLHEDQ